MAKSTKKTTSNTTPTNERKTRQKADIPENETREQRFIRVGTPRIKKALKAISNLKHLANKRQYGFTEQQTERIFAAFELAISEVKRAFTKVQEQTIEIDLNMKVGE